MGDAARTEVVWAPQPGPQAAFVTCPAFEVVYGGARGGGKTDASLGEWAIHADRYGEHAKGLFIRRTRVALEPTIERAKTIYRQLGAEWQEQKSRFVWPNGAVLYFRYLERDADADNYQGHDYTRVYVEELTQFREPGPVNKLKATLRSAAGVPTGFRATCNPGGPGHGWVKARYIDPGPWRIVKESFENPFTGETIETSRVFIPAKLSDNPRLLDNDPQYVANLYLAGSDSLVKAWLDGDWNVIEGAFFDCWSSRRHVVRPFEIPVGWTKFLSGDWGSAKPYSFGWWAVVSDPYRVPDGPLLPRGCLVRYRELYGVQKDQPNVGLKQPAEQVGRIIATLNGKDDLRYGVIDPATFASDGGPSIAERLRIGLKAGNASIALRAADNKRVAARGAMGGWDQMRSRFIGDADGNPMVVCFSTCRDSIRTIPVLQHDQSRAEDLDTSAEDHAADDWRYGLMSRPWTPPARSGRPKPRDAWDHDDHKEGGDWKTA